MSDTEVAIVGAGIAGSLAALALAEQGIEVTLVDRAGMAMTGASRWNEGKIHLGYCYLGDETMASAALMLDGAAAFLPTIERLTGRRVESDWFTEPVVYLVDPGTLFPPAELWSRASLLAEMLRQRADSEPGLRRWLGEGPVLERLAPDVAAARTGLGHIAEAFVTGERAVDPAPVADLVRAALAERGIEVVAASVDTTVPGSSGWTVHLGDQRLTAPVVINAAWESRPGLDRAATGRDHPCSIRYKYGVFVRGAMGLAALAPSTRIVGPYGDVTPYGNGAAYFSWYPAGLAGLSDDGTPPEPAPPPRIEAMLAGLGLDPSVLDGNDVHCEIRGGYVVAHGQGDIDHAASPLHRRSRPDASELAPGFISIDTGKYSLGPLMAQRAAELAVRRLARPDSPRQVVATAPAS